MKELLLKFQRAFDGLVSKHEEFTTLIDADCEYENEKKWLAECLKVFLKSELTAKEFMGHVQDNKALRDENDQFAENPEIVDRETAEAAVEGQQQSDGIQNIQEASQDVSNEEIVGTRKRNDKEHSQQ